MAMKSIKSLKGVSFRPVKIPKFNTTHLSGMKSSSIKGKGKSIKKF